MEHGHFPDKINPHTPVFLLQRSRPQAIEVAYGFHHDFPVRLQGCGFKDEIELIGKKAPRSCTDAVAHFRPGAGRQLLGFQINTFPPLGQQLAARQHVVDLADLGPGQRPVLAEAEDIVCHGKLPCFFTAPSALRLRTGEVSSRTPRPLFTTEFLAQTWLVHDHFRPIRPEVINVIVALFWRVIGRKTGIHFS